VADRPAPPAPHSAEGAAHLDLTGAVPVVVVDVPGWLDLATAPEVRIVVEAALDSRPQRLAVDLSGCELADAYGLGMLATAQRRGRAQGTELVLVGVNRRIRRVLALSGLAGALPVTELDRVSA
jgi:anti-sigma B factor antagonist